MWRLFEPDCGFPLANQTGEDVLNIVLDQILRALQSWRSFQYCFGLNTSSRVINRKLFKFLSAVILGIFISVLVRELAGYRISGRNLLVGYPAYPQSWTLLIILSRVWKIQGALINLFVLCIGDHNEHLLLPVAARLAADGNMRLGLPVPLEQNTSIFVMSCTYVKGQFCPSVPL